jgi:hypothetical protein
MSVARDGGGVVVEKTYRARGAHVHSTLLQFISFTPVLYRPQMSLLIHL